MDNVNFKSKVFDEALKIVIKEYIQKEITEYNDINESDCHIFPPEFETKMNVILKYGKKFKVDIRKYFLKVFKRTAMIVLIILSVSFLSLLSVKAVRIEIFNFITTIYEKFINIRFTDTQAINSIEDFPSETVEEVYIPSYIPDRYKEDSISKSNFQTKVIYINDENQKIFYYQRLFSADVSIDGQDYIINEISVNGVKGKVYEYNKSDDNLYYIIVWTDNKYSYQLIGYLSKDELLKMAASIKLQNTEK